MKEWKWQYIAALVLEIAGLVFMVLSMATDINDDLFLPVALGCIGGANLLMLVMNIRQNGKTGDR